MNVNKIYSYNITSRKMFEGLVFKEIGTKFDAKGREYSSYKLILN